MFISCPPHLAQKMSPEMQNIIGYKKSISVLRLADVMPPATCLEEGYDISIPGKSGMRRCRWGGS